MYIVLDTAASKSSKRSLFSDKENKPLGSLDGQVEVKISNIKISVHYHVIRSDSLMLNFQFLKFRLTKNAVFPLTLWRGGDRVGR